MGTKRSNNSIGHRVSNWSLLGCFSWQSWVYYCLLWGCNFLCIRTFLFSGVFLVLHKSQGGGRRRQVAQHGAGTSARLHRQRLLNVEHVDKNGKPVLYLVFEYLDTDLKKFIDLYRKGPNPRPLPPTVVQSFLYQLCKGVAHCHSHGVLHRDLKPQNLLVDKEKGILKIADLGLGRAFTIPLKSYTHEIVTLWYRAPEVLLGTSHYSTGVDMWSVGCIFAEMVKRQALFPGDSELQQLLHIFRLLGTPTEEQWPGVSTLRDWHEYPQWKPQNLARAVPTLEPEGIDLLSKMLQYDPANRISAKAAMEHPYFESLDKSQF